MTPNNFTTPLCPLLRAKWSAILEMYLLSSTDWTLHCLTSVIGRELVCWMWYGHWHLKGTILSWVVIAELIRSLKLSSVECSQYNIYTFRDEIVNHEKNSKIHNELITRMKATSRIGNLLALWLIYCTMTTVIKNLVLFQWKKIWVCTLMVKWKQETL